MARAISQSLLSERHIYSRVLCPSRVPQQQGHSFACSARFAVGSYAVSVTEVDGRGHVRWSSRAPVGVLQMQLVTSAIRRSVLARRGVLSTVTCPSQVLQHKGLSFRCTAVVNSTTGRVKPGAYAVDVTEVDSAGDVTYVGR